MKWVPNIVTHFGYSFITNYVTSDTNRKRHPSYLYVRVDSTYNNTLPTTPDVMTVKQAPSVPSQAEFHSRVRSFTDWPEDTGIRVADLVKSEFYYLGYNDLVVFSVRRYVRKLGSWGWRGQ